jgi:hypothetical protein
MGYQEVFHIFKSIDSTWNDIQRWFCIVNKELDSVRTGRPKNEINEPRKWSSYLFNSILNQRQDTSLRAACGGSETDKWKTWNNCLWWEPTSYMPAYAFDIYLTICELLKCRDKKYFSSQKKKVDYNSRKTKVYATSRKVVGSKPDEIDTFFRFVWSLRQHLYLGFAVPLTEMSSRHRKIMFIRSRTRPVCKANNLTVICEPTIWTTWDPQHPATL